MYERMKGYNFRFTEDEIIVLDAVKREMQKSQQGFSSWRRLTRTDVIKMLIRREWASIQKRYEDEKCRELTSTKTAKKQASKKAKPVKTRRTPATQR